MEKEQNVKKLQRLLDTCKSVMQIKVQKISVDFEDQVSALQSELETLQEKLTERQDESHEPSEKFREKNKQIQNLLDEIKEMENINVELATQVNQLKRELTQATNDMQLSSRHLEMLKHQLEESQQLNKHFIEEKQQLVTEIEAVKNTLQNSGDNEVATNYAKLKIKHEILEKQLQAKDNEIGQLLTSQKLRPGAEDEKRVKNLQEEIQQRDKHIDLLKSQLKEATKDIETQSQILQNMMQEIKKVSDHEALNRKIEALTQRVKAYENEVLSKDNDLLQLRQQISSFEQVHISSEEIEGLKVSEHKTSKIELNSSSQANLLDQNNATKITDVRNEEQLDKQRLTIMVMQEELAKLEDENINLKQQLRIKGGSENLRNIPNEEFDQLMNQSKSLQKENNELQLAMKEILNFLQDSDSKNDVVIECPSLERLCQLMESKAVSPDLMNVIVLKAELDLLRGHNEQLRVEMKRLRNDHVKLIADYTKVILENDFQKDSLRKVEILEKEDRDSETSTPETVEEATLVKAPEDLNKIDENDTFDEEVADQSSVINNFLSNDFIDKKSFESKETQTPFYEEPKLLPQESFSLPEAHEVERIETLAPQQSFIGQQQCQNCISLGKVFHTLKNSFNRLENFAFSNEEKFIKQIQLLMIENKVSEYN